LPHVANQCPVPFFTLLRVASNPPQVVQNVVWPHNEENLVPKPFDQGVIKENLALVHCVLLKNVVERHRELILVLDEFSIFTVSKVFLIVNPREKKEHE
jgi:hypothetical protein